MTSNWAGNITFEAERVAVPASTAEVSEVVRAAVAAGQSVRALGSGHSFNRIADTSGVDDFRASLRAQGAWLVLPAPFAAGCLGR